MIVLGVQQMSAVNERVGNPKSGFGLLKRCLRLLWNLDKSLILIYSYNNQNYFCLASLKGKIKRLASSQG